MTPIKIEPNSGTKMAGVKVKQSGWNVDCYEEIVFIANSSILLRDKNGIESLCRIDCRDGWYLYEEPKAEVKKVLKPAMLVKNLIGGDSLYACNANPHIKPARVVFKNLKYETVDLNNPESEIVSADLYFEYFEVEE